MVENIKYTKFINPGQTPVDCSDQPVFTLTKELQFRFLLFGGLYIEQSLLLLHVQLIKGFGLMEILNHQKLSTIGLSVVVDLNSIKRATYFIQVTLSTHYIKVNEATALDNLNKACPYDWPRQKSSEKEMCFFWKMVFGFSSQLSRVYKIRT